MDQLDLDKPSAVPSPRAGGFFDSQVVKRAARWDNDRPDSTAGEIDVIVTVNWPDAGRALRAVQIVDLELRRCAAALEAVREDSPPNQRPTAGDVLAELCSATSPAGPPRSSLDLVRADGPPLNFVLKPVGALFDVLATHAACATAFAIARFGLGFELSLSSPEGGEQVPSQAHRIEGPYRAISSPHRRFDRGFDVSIRVIRRYGSFMDEIKASCTG